MTAPDKLWVSGGGAALELGLAPDFRIVIADETHLHGEVIVRRGRIDALGRRFDLKADSSLQFEGAPDHPTLDATAQYQDNDDNVTVLVTAKGPIDHLTIGVSSPNRPDLNQSQLYTLIITGHLPSSGGSSGGGVGAAASERGGVAGRRRDRRALQKTLAKHLPLDVLTIDTGGGAGADGDAARGRPLRHRQALRRLRRTDRRRSDAVPESKRRPRRVPTDRALADRGRVRRRRDRLGRPDVEEELLSARADRAARRAGARRAPAGGELALARPAARRLNVHPVPGTERTPTRPPCASAIRLTVARPRPMPGWRLFGPRTYGSNTCSPSSAGSPGPLSSTSIRTRTRPCRSVDRPRADDDARRRDAARIFDRVAKQVRDQAGQNARVAGDRRPARRPRRRSRSPSLCRLAGRDLLDGAGDHLGDVGLDARLRAERPPARRPAGRRRSAARA